MNVLKSLLLTGLLICLWGEMLAQTLPVFSIDRRTNLIYMDSLARLARRQCQSAIAQIPTARNDTLRFQALYYLGRLYSWWEGRQDSTLYFGSELTRQARIRRNVEFEVKGILLNEYYYNDIRTDYPEALRLNYQAKAVLQRAKQDFRLNWRIDLNLGELYGRSGDYQKALEFLKSAQTGIAKGSGVTPQTTIGYQASMEQKMGNIYNRQNKFRESETHYLAAKTLLERGSSESNRAYIYDDLGELYRKYGQLLQAMHFAKKAATIWKKINPHRESNSLGTLALVYLGLGQDDQAFEYAQKILHRPNATKHDRRKAYITLYQVAEHRQDWQNEALYYKKYVAVRDTINNDEHSLELASIQKRAEFERLTLQNQQAQELQAERLLTVQKQAELDHLRATAKATTLTKKAELSEQQRRFDNEQAKTALSRQRTTQRLQRQAFEQQALQQKNQTQQSWLFFTTSSSLLLVVVLTLLLYSARLRKRKAEAELRIVREREEADTRLIQTQESERQRIAADLHDDLGGTLATIRHRITDLRQHLPNPAAVQSFEALEPLIQKSGEDLRRVAHNLMPPEFVRIGLCSALERLVTALPPQPTSVEFRVTGRERRLSMEVELNAYRIVSELTQNVLKHAQARRATVQLLYFDTCLSITVEDDGVGKQKKKRTPIEQGIGLKTSKLRAEYIGAMLQWEWNKGGTLVVLEIPYPDPTNARGIAPENSADRRPSAI